MPTTVSVVDDIAPISISAVPQPAPTASSAATASPSPPARPSPSSSAPPTRIRGSRQRKLASWSVAARPSEANCGQQPGRFHHDRELRLQAAGDGAEIVITPQANDVERGLMPGRRHPARRRRHPPTSAPSLIAPAAATTFGTPRSFHCLSAGDAALSGLRGTADTVAVNVQISPLPAGFPADGQNLNTEVNPGWVDLGPQGFQLGRTEYGHPARSRRRRKPAGRRHPASRSGRHPRQDMDGDSILTRLRRPAATALADYQPVMTGTWRHRRRVPVMTGW